jgi:hypothetical protein
MLKPLHEMVARMPKAKRQQFEYVLLVLLASVMAIGAIAIAFRQALAHERWHQKEFRVGVLYGCHAAIVAEGLRDPMNCEELAKSVTR